MGKKPLNMSPCGKVSKTSCRNRTINLPECDGCTLVRRIYQHWKMIDKKPHKKCIVCGEYKHVDEFYLISHKKNDKTYHRYDSYCKECKWKYQKEYDEKRKRGLCDYTV